MRARGQSSVDPITLSGCCCCCLIHPSSSSSSSSSPAVIISRSARISSSRCSRCRLAFSRDAHHSMTSRVTSSPTPRDVTFTSVSTFTCLQSATATTVGAAKSNVKLRYVTLYTILQYFEYFCKNFNEIDPYNFELWRFKVGAFSLRHSVVRSKA